MWQRNESTSGPTPWELDDDDDGGGGSGGGGGNDDDYDDDDDDDDVDGYIQRNLIRASFNCTF